MGMPRRAGQVCNATEILLRSGRKERGVDDHRPPESSGRPPQDDDGFFADRVEVGLLRAGRQLQSALTVLSPYRTDDGELHTAYVATHDALGDLAATYTWVTLERQARRARRAPHRRPSGG